MPQRTYLELNFDPACLADSNGRMRSVNDPMLGLLGLDRAHADSVHLADLLGPKGFAELSRNAGEQPATIKRLSVRVHGGAVQPMEARAMRLPNGDLALVLRPLAAYAATEGAEHMALHDALTGLPNRVLLLDRLNQTLARVRRHNDFAAVIFIDLDGFKPVNDTYGHECGDEVLRATARRLLEVVRGDDTAARIGGDEFVMILGELKNGLHAGLTGNRIIKSLTQPVGWKGSSVRVSASLGIAVAPTDGDDPETLLRKADEAMYVAKKSGKNGYSFYNESSYFD